MVEITPELVLKAYAAGIFPMAEDRRDERLFWVDPDHRGVIPLDRFHLPRRLGRTVLANRFEVTADRAFAGVIRACAGERRGHHGTWINDRILTIYGELHERGFVHSVETWDEGRLVGGLYGVSLGGAFFGESMFSTVRDASKVALVHLVGRLKLGGYILLDTQFVTEHLQQFGAVEIARKDYLRRLEAALEISADFYCAGAELSAETILQSITQTS
ncbi:MAG: leucyl/phenylalanyl-tRNA--protein transferase [Alphaproteobacteria bacterium]|jgi:leucyl/phenylalanyl-tRNA--protein transferase|nr:leucyl/phenylalanyl-tRNA--protein transferase [Alphaproteobacteria bacterium]